MGLPVDRNRIVAGRSAVPPTRQPGPPMAEVLELIAGGANPARHIKTGGVVSHDE
jgi:hypothetical protein